MYLAVDVGGTKTLLGCFDNDGKMVKKESFPTPSEYKDFLDEIGKTLKGLGDYDFRAAGIALPGRLDREHGRILNLGNLGWKNVPVQADIEAIINVPVVIENDAKSAGLSEADLIKDDFRKVMYITISTGIGVGLIIDGVIPPDFQDMEGGMMLLEHSGKLQKWEAFASGKAIVKKFGKRAEDITDKESWKEISRNLAVGINNLIAVFIPEVIVVGGGVGQYFNKFSQYLLEELKKYENPLVPLPTFRVAQRPEEAVIYGAYLLAKQRFGAHAKAK